MNWICLILMVCNLAAVDHVEYISMEFFSKASYPIEHTPYKKVAFAGIKGDQLNKIDHWIFNKLSNIPELELIRPDVANPAVNLLLDIQGHTSLGLKKLKKILGVQALLQGELEIFVRENLVVYFELYLYDLDTGMSVNTISRNWTIPVNSRSRQVLYEEVVTKILEEINQEWYSYEKIANAPWYKDSHANAGNVIKLIKSNLLGEAFNLMFKEKRDYEIQLFNHNKNKIVKNSYQLILYHLGLLNELNGQFKRARQFYDLAIKHGAHSESVVFMESKRRVKKRW